MSVDIGATQKAILPAGDPGWLGLRHETVLDPNRRIIDPHHHLWGPPRQKYLLDDFAADYNAGHRIVATVFADCTEGYRTDGPEAYKAVGETEFAVRVAEDAASGRVGDTKVHAGIISRADLGEGDSVRGVLEAHIEAGKGRFKGVRFSSAWDPDPEVRSTVRTPPARLLYDPKVRQGAANMGKLGLVLDSWSYFHQLGDIADFAAALPDVSIVLDHVGGPLGIASYAGRRDELFPIWKAGLLAVAQRPNVTVKIGGLAMRFPGFGFEKQPSPPSSSEIAAAWKPYVETAIEAFGPERSMFESNFPVDQLSCSYVTLWNAFKRLAANYSESEKDAMFRGTANRIYRLGLAD
ncbi:MAG: amidohydrolase [Rhizorhabdus sp.]|nr:amidohydrolase [Rhizorhabdus sp.]